MKLVLLFFIAILAPTAHAKERGFFCYQPLAPIAQTANAPTLLNGWMNSGAPYAPVAYSKDSSGVVHLEGSMHGGSTGTVFVLPTDYRPAGGHFFWVMAGGVPGVLYVHTDGQVFLSPQGGGNAPASWNTHVSLSGTTFRASP